MTPYELLVIDSFEKEAALGEKLFHRIYGHGGGKIMEGLRRSAANAGSESFLAAPIVGLANKAFGKGKAQDFMWRNVSKPAMVADMALGEKLQKIPFAKSLFTQKESIPWGHDKLNLSRHIERPSALAPLNKVKNIATPIIVGVGLQKGVHHVRDSIKARTSLPEETREKIASTMLQMHSRLKEHEKRAMAERTLFDLIEKGTEVIPKTHQEFELKLASLMGHNLTTAVPARELISGNVKLGELEEGSYVRNEDPAAIFMAEIMAPLNY
jgi:hypothetical protein